MYLSINYLTHRPKRTSLESSALIIVAFDSSLFELDVRSNAKSAVRLT